MRMSDRGLQDLATYIELFQAIASLQEKFYKTLDMLRDDSTKLPWCGLERTACRLTMCYP